MVSRNRVVHCAPPSACSCCPGATKTGAREQMLPSISLLSSTSWARASLLSVAVAPVGQRGSPRAGGVNSLGLPAGLPWGGVLLTCSDSVGPPSFYSLLQKELSLHTLINWVCAFSRQLLKTAPSELESRN